MIDKRIVIIIICVLLFDGAIALLGNTWGEIDDEEGLRVAVTIPPQEQFVKKVGGDRVKVTLMVPPGEDPHSYEPTPRQMREVAKADIYFKLGSKISFETRWMDKIKSYNEEMTIVNCSEEIQLRKMRSTIDPHVWMSPLNAIRVVENIRTALIEEDDANSPSYDENAKEYTSKLGEIHQDIKSDMENYEGKKFLVYHPSFGYFADEYNLTQVPIEKEGKEPGTKEVQHIIDQAKKENISVVFVSPQFDQSQAQTIAEGIDGEVISLNPLAEDYIENIREMGNKLTSAFKGSRGDDLW
ncbi:MAG: zinc ABC transporter substrate-binding protein [Candidatus Thermoplasmatota archaeon]|nr:zinc ABC transporter substrate-binding protein [Candidatus Thermoplasmatota archaeon]MBS3789430.1 zinc ABC transporter substrate-binding protein [Candidatus Thermoplasmatota archaeon]